MPRRSHVQSGGSKIREDQRGIVKRGLGDPGHRAEGIQPRWPAAITSNVYGNLGLDDVRDAVKSMGIKASSRRQLVAGDRVAVADTDAEAER
jgi:hypothetical protein